VKFAQQELMFALIFRAVVIGRYHDAHAGDLIVQGNEPGPMMFLAIKNQRVAAGCTGIADASDHLRKNRCLAIVATTTFFASHSGIAKKSSLPGSVHEYFRCDVLECAVCADAHATNCIAV